MSSSLSLSNPLDALILPRVLRWIAVVFRQKSKCGHLDAVDGRPWTRLPAKDLVAQLEREEGLVVSVRRVQRSLARLVEGGHLARCQRTKWWGQRDAWFSWSDEEWALQQHRPTAVARSSSASAQSDRSRRSEASVPSPQDLSNPLLTQTTSKTERTSATSSLDGKGACVPLEGASKAQQAPTPRGKGKGPSQDLQRAIQRANARGFAKAVGSRAVATPSLQTESWVEGDFRFTRLPSGHVVKDLLATAPIR